MKFFATCARGLEKILAAIARDVLGEKGELPAFGHFIPRRSDQPHDDKQENPSREARQPGTRDQFFEK